MPDRHDHHNHTTTEDEALLAGARRLLRGLQRHPVALGFLAVVAAAALFRMGVFVGETVYVAFNGDDMMAAVYGATFVTALVVLIAAGVWLDGRKRTRDTNTGPANHDQPQP